MEEISALVEYGLVCTFKVTVTGGEEVSRYHHGKNQPCGFTS
jgi:hypothetical protein